ncbi:MAG TPA: hybrid sensor histidine kinase/response regulator [Verrucomicrobia bacterium]|nr:hybrid sensor histidine kinase/response regulator [Verrucomicrobiota bacterium]
MSDENDNTLDPEMYAMFCEEVAGHMASLERDLVRLESSPTPEVLESLMRAAHSIKGAARIIGLTQAVGLAHRMEDFFVAMQEGRASADADRVDVLLQASDVYKQLRLQTASDAVEWLCMQAVTMAQLEDALSGFASDNAVNTVETPADEPFAADNPNLDMMDLFKIELETHLEVLRRLPSLRSAPGTSETGEELSRAAHSIKGAARIVGLEGMARLAGAIETFFEAARENPLLLTGLPDEPAGQTLAFLDSIACLPLEEIPVHLMVLASECEGYAVAWKGLVASPPEAGPPPSAAAAADEPALAPSPKTVPTPPAAAEGQEVSSLLVTTETLDKLTGLAGEAWVESRQLESHVRRLYVLRERQHAIENIVRTAAFARGQATPDMLAEVRGLLRETSDGLAEAWRGLQQYGFEAEDLSSRLYNAAIAARMRPLADGLKAFPRLVRDMARQLDKKIRFETVGSTTRVDRDVLSQLDAPLTHILRNACDHGIETVPERLAAGKPEQGVIRVEGSHRGGMLVVAVHDDGRGMNLERIKAKVLERKMAGPDLVERMSTDELLEFLFLPGFSTTSVVSEFSGRGVGMDVVRTMLTAIGGVVHLRTVWGRGSVVEMQLPLSLALLRTLVVTVNDEIYAIPLARVSCVRRARPEDVSVVEGRLLFTHGDGQVPLLKLDEVLQLPSSLRMDHDWPLVLCGETGREVAFAVERIVEEKDMVLHPLDLRLGKPPAINAGAIMEDGAIALILDTEDLLQLATKALSVAPVTAAEVVVAHDRRRVLVVDDSVTVREVERRLLERHGCHVDLAVDGLDGWNQARSNRYDLILSDVDMPRMNGIDFVTRLKQDPLLKDIPVIIVSYKDKEEDRIRGLKAGANYYLTKGSFQDDSLIRAVQYLIGEL